MADTIQPTPRSNKLLGLLADALGGAYDYAQRPDPTMPMGLANPVLGLLSNALPLKAGVNVLDDLSYGRAPIRGTGYTTRLTPDATELAMAAAPFPKTSGRAALAAMGAVDTGVGKAMFIGPTAKTWDKAAAATAQKMEKAGADPRAIWSETGTFKGPDGKWRQEISDHGAVLDHPMPNIVELRNRSRDAKTLDEAKQLGDEYNRWMDTVRGSPAVTSLSVTKREDISGLRHPALLDAYPEGQPRIWWENIGTPKGGSFDEGRNRVSIGLGSYADPAESKSIALHELQHAIQQREGFARGGSPADFSGPKTDEALKELIARQTQGLEPFSAEAQAIRDRLFDSLKSDDAIGYAQKLYRRLAGEAESRATQARMDMTPEQRRATFPYDSYDVPVNQLIVRGLLD